MVYNSYRNKIKYRFHYSNILFVVTSIFEQLLLTEQIKDRATVSFPLSETVMGVVDVGHISC